MVYDSFKDAPSIVSTLGIGGSEEDSFKATIVHITARHEVKNNERYVMESLLQDECRRNNINLSVYCVDVKKWAQALMPWPDPAVSRDEDVGRHAAETLNWLLNNKGEVSMWGSDPLPWGTDFEKHSCIVLGGYSLGGLFALWAARQCRLFQGVAAVSPSLWIQDWCDFAKANPIQTQSVYLSLGLREEHCRNKYMARVGDCVRREHALLVEQLGEDRTTLEWNGGGHFVNEGARMAKGYLWTLINLRQQQASHFHHF